MVIEHYKFINITRVKFNIIAITLVIDIFIIILAIIVLSFITIMDSLYITECIIITMEIIRYSIQSFMFIHLDIHNMVLKLAQEL